MPTMPMLMVRVLLPLKDASVVPVREPAAVPGAAR